MEKNEKPVLNRHEFVLQALDEFERPLTEYASRLFHGDLHAARDAVQHTFMQLCKQAPDSVSDKVRPWLYTVCRNHIFDQHKSKSKRSTSGAEYFDMVDEKATDPATQFEREDLYSEIKKLCFCLNSGEQEVIDLWAHGFKATEIAEMIGKKPSLVRVNLHRAIKRLKQHPKIAKWLERATGPLVESEKEPGFEPFSVLNPNGTSTKSISGKRS